MTDDRLKRPRDPIALAKVIGDIATGQKEFGPDWGVITLDAKAFDQLSECMKNPGQPNQKILEGAKLLRALPSKSR